MAKKTLLLSAVLILLIGCEQLLQPQTDADQSLAFGQSSSASIAQLVTELAQEAKPAREFYTLRNRLLSDAGEYRRQLEALTETQLGNVLQNLNLLYESTDTSLNRNLNYWGSFLHLTSAKPLHDLVAPITAIYGARGFARGFATKIPSLLPKFNNVLGAAAIDDLRAIAQYSDLLAVEEFAKFLRNARVTPLTEENGLEKIEQFQNFLGPIFSGLSAASSAAAEEERNPSIAFAQTSARITEQVIGQINSQFIDDYLVLATPWVLGADDIKAFPSEVAGSLTAAINRNRPSERRYQNEVATLGERPQRLRERIDALGVPAAEMDRIIFALSRQEPDTTITFSHAIKVSYPTADEPLPVDVRMLYGIDIGAGNPQAAMTTLNLRCLDKITLTQANLLIVMWQKMKAEGILFVDSHEIIDAKRSALFMTNMQLPEMRELMSRDSCPNLRQIFLDACRDIDAKTLRMGSDGRFSP